MRVEVTQSAQREIAAASAHLVVHSPAGARRILFAVRAAINSLETFPERGRRTELKDVRELVIRNTPHIIAYVVRGDVVFVTRLRHIRQDPTP